VAFRNSSSRRQLIGFLDIFTGGGHLPPSACSRLGILAVHQRFDHPAAAHSGHFPARKISRRTRGAGRRKIAQITAYVALGWGCCKAPSLPCILRQYALPGVPDLSFVIQTALALVTGSDVVMWTVR